jgi:3',5'-cyclic AMP phosphodiesterase CpdA
MRLLILSDVHFAGAAEQARIDFEASAVKNPALRGLLRLYRNHIWLREPTRQNYLLDDCLDREPNPDMVIANGDYSCDSAFVGVSDPAALASAGECLASLRDRYGDKLLAVMGDHELGKRSLLGERGGLRYASLQKAETDLGLAPFWERRVGLYTFIGVTSTLLALPLFEREALPGELEAWRARRARHLREIESAFAALPPDGRLVLFCHDPTALPFLWREQFVRERAALIERTIIGHLHSPLILWNSRLLRGMPTIPFMGTTVRRISSALGASRDWRHFRVALCPSLAGIELLKDGGYLVANLDPEGRRPLELERSRLPRRDPRG